MTALSPSIFLDNSTFATATYIDVNCYTSGSNADLVVPSAPSVVINDILGSNSDVNVYRVPVLPDDAGNVTLTFDIDHTYSPNPQAALDTVLLLYSSSGVLLASNDDRPIVSVDAGSSTFIDSYLSYTTAPGDDFYYVVVDSFNGQSYGQYDLNISVTGAVGIQNYGNGAFGNDSLFGDDQGVTNDTIFGFSGNDIIQSFDGDDFLYGGDGDDDIDGGEGNDTIYGDTTQTWIIDYRPGAGDTLHGGNGDDTISGGNGDDQIFGDAGADTLWGSYGSNRIDGGAGADIYTFQDEGYDVGADTFVIRNLESTMSATDVFEFNQFNSDDTGSFNGAGVAGGDLIELAGFNGPVFWQGAASFTNFAGSVLPGGGNGVMDAAYTFSGGSTLIAVDTDDDGHFGANDTLIEFDSYEVNLIASDFTPAETIGWVLGNATADNWTGTAAADYYLGRDGDDIIKGLGGMDLLLGEAGKDLLNGGDGNDSLQGGADNDRLFGGTGKDHMFGGDGADVLTGGGGQDTMTGNAGADRFVYTAITESGIAIAGRDIIIDFTHLSDKIDLSAIDAIAGGANDAFILRGGNLAGHIVVVQSGADTLLKLNTDADTAAEATILLTNVTASTLTPADFIL